MKFGRAATTHKIFGLPCMMVATDPTSIEQSRTTVDRGGRMSDLRSQLC